MNIKEYEQRLKTIEKIAKSEGDIEIFKYIKLIYEQSIEQIKILKSINDFEPDPLGIDLDRQIATFAKKVAKEYLIKIKEI